MLAMLCALCRATAATAPGNVYFEGGSGSGGGSEIVVIVAVAVDCGLWMHKRASGSVTRSSPREHEYSNNGHGTWYTFVCAKTDESRTAMPRGDRRTMLSLLCRGVSSRDTHTPTAVGRLGAVLSPCSASFLQVPALVDSQHGILKIAAPRLIIESNIVIKMVDMACSCHHGSSPVADMSRVFAGTEWVPACEQFERCGVPCWVPYGVVTVWRRKWVVPSAEVSGKQSGVG